MQTGLQGSPAWPRRQLAPQQADEQPQDWSAGATTEWLSAWREVARLDLGARHCDFWWPESLSRHRALDGTG